MRACCFHRVRAAVAVLLPLLFGLSGCLTEFPVPVGDPEKSRIDAQLSGVWMGDDETSFHLYRPYDKRTWIVGGASIDLDTDACTAKHLTAGDGSASDSAAAEHLRALLAGQPGEPQFDDPQERYERLIASLQLLGSDCYASDVVPAFYKAWQTRLGGEWFMTWEPIFQFDAKQGFTVTDWTVLHLDKSTPDSLRLTFLESSHPGWDVLDDVEKADLTRRMVEKVIRKHAQDPAFYSDDVLLMQRVQPQHYPLLAALFDAEF